MNSIEKISYETMKYMRGNYRLDEVGDAGYNAPHFVIVILNMLDFLSVNGLIILEFCGSIEAVFSILSTLHTGRRQQWVNPLMVKNWVKASRRERMVFIRDGS